MINILSLQPPDGLVPSPDHRRRLLLLLLRGPSTTVGSRSVHVGYYPAPLITRPWYHLAECSSAACSLLYYSSSDSGSGRLPVGCCAPDLVNEAGLNIGDVLLPRMPDGRNECDRMLRLSVLRASV